MKILYVKDFEGLEAALKYADGLMNTVVRCKGDTWAKEHPIYVVAVPGKFSLYEEYGKLISSPCSPNGS